MFGTEDHPSVAASLHELAGVLRAQGELAGARETCEIVLEIKGRVFGTREHFSTAITETNLGLLLPEQGETDRAQALLTHALGVFLKQLG